MLERLKHDKTIDIYGHVTCLRAQRNYVVQTEDQYIFIHDALAEAIISGNTEVVASDLLNHIQMLSQPEPGEVVTGTKYFMIIENGSVRISVAARPSKEKTF